MSRLNIFAVISLSLVFAACNGGTSSDTSSAGSTGGPGGAAASTSGSTSGSTGSTSGSTTGGRATGSSTGSSTGASSGTTGSAGAVLSVDKSSLNFGNVVINSTATLSVKLSDPSSIAATSLHAAFSGTDRSLFVAGTVPTTLAASSSADIQVMFTPLGLETESSAVLTFTDQTPTGSASVSLSGVPVGTGIELGANPIDFGTVAQNVSKVGCITLTAWANVPVTISSVGNFSSAGGVFAVSQTDDSTPSNPAPIPVTIPVGGSAKVCFSFTPKGNVEYEGQATLVTDDPSGTNPIVQLVGMGGSA